MKRHGLVFVPLVLSIAGACSRGDGGRAMREERRLFQIVMESKMKQIDRGITLLRGVATVADSAYESDIDDLKRGQRSLRERLATIDSASDEEWPALRDSVEVHYHGLRARFGELSHREVRPLVVPVSAVAASPDTATSAMTPGAR